MPSRKNGNFQVIDILYNNSDVIITLDNDRTITVKINAYLANSPLIKGQFIDDKMISNLELINEKELILEAAYQLLNSKMYSCSNLRKKLLKVSSNYELAGQVIGILIEKNYLNDAQYAYQHASNNFAGGKGWNYICQKLIQDGISEEVLSLTREKFSTQYEENNAKEIARKLLKSPSKKSHQQQLALVYHNLLTKGFSEEMTEQIVSSSKYYNHEIEIRNAKIELAKLKKKYINMTDKRELYMKIYSSLLNKGYKSGIIKEVIKEVDIYD